ncbi:M20/M25/M40 family metallo-hydrolase, partial [Lutispora sp.]|uniref:M20/M25/M40 family metallo-hydrolase n=1 Tax=Lutispora sp. TaxID=2828727 RepID=UPI00356848D6
MFKKRLSLVLAVVMILSMVFSTVFASPDIGSYMPETRKEAIEGSHRGYEVDSFEKPDMSNPFGAVPTKEDKIEEPVLLKSFSQDFVRTYEDDGSIDIIRDREGDLTPEDMVGVREIEENPYGAVKSDKVIADEDDEQQMMALKADLMDIFQSDEYGTRAYEHVEYLSKVIGARRAGTEKEYKARDYIKEVLEDIGYSVKLQGFSPINVSSMNSEYMPKFAREPEVALTIEEDEEKSVTEEVYEEPPVSYRYYNVIATKPGLSDEVVIVGAHYDSVSSGGSVGADDNASGVGIMLEAAEILASMNTPYTIKFIAFGAEEIGLRGSRYYVENMTEEEIENTIAMINLDSCIGGDFAYVYGGFADDPDGGWVRDKALALAQNLGLDLRTNPGLNPYYPEGTTGDWSDHVYFRRAGIPYAYFEATNWEIGDKDGYDQTVEYGPIMHSGRDNLDFIEREFPGRVEDRLHTFVTVLTNLLLCIDEPLYQGMELSGNLASMTEERVFDVAVNFGYLPDLDELQWTFGGILFEEWKKVDYSDGSTIEDSFIKFETEPYLDGSTVKARIKFELPFGRFEDEKWVPVDTLDRRPYPRTYYPRLLGTYDLTVTDEDRDVAISSPIKLNAYDSYHTWEELKPAIDKIIDKTRAGRYIEYKSLGESIEGRDCHFVILAESKAAVNKYLNEILPMALEDPAELQRMIYEKELLDYKIPIWFNNIHPDEAPGTDAVLGLLEMLATQNKVEYEDIEINEGKEEIPSTKNTVTLSVPELLDNFIFLFNFTVNPDGRYYNTRTNVNGFDINRDCSFQTQPEAVNTIKAIVEWKPLTFLDFHGHVKEFLVEPTTPPHDPNYEYDLLVHSMLEQAYLMGRAGIGSTRYESFIVPREDYDSGWDDASPVYTPMYAMHHGALGHTIEIPDINEHSHDALVACGLAAAKYALDNKDRLYRNQLEVFRRGVENIDAKALVDPEFVDGNGQVVGRPRGDNANYFPEYYVIPVDASMQKNILEAHLIVDYLLRNGILVDVTTEDVTIGDKTYPKGSYVVDMHQAIRGYANAILSDGFDISTFDDMYAETVMNFPDVWGFDRDIIREAGVFQGKTKRISSVSMPETGTPNASDYYIIKNNNNDAIRGINELLRKGEKVSMTLSSGEDYEAGDFVISKKALFMIKDKYFLEVLPYDGGSLIKDIPKPEIGLAGSGNIEFVLRELGFDYSTSLANSNVILATGSTNVKSYIDNGIPYVGIGANPIRFVGTNGILAVNRRSTGYEGLLKSKIAKDSLINSNYKEEEYILNPYGSGVYFTAVPDNVKVLARVTTDDDYFKAGWWPGSEEVKGAALAVQGEYNNTPITLFAFNIANKGQPKHFFRMMANAIYTSLMDIDEATGEMELSNNKASMTEKRIIEARFNLGEDVTAEDLEWTYGGKPLSDWKKYASGGYNGDPFINVIEVKIESDNTVRAKIEFDLPYGTNDLSGSARRRYPALIGTYDLVAKNKNTGSMAKGAIKLNAYDSYHTWDEIKPAIDEILLKAQDDRYLEYKVLGKSTEGRDMHHVILAKNRKAIDTYLNKTLPLMKEDPAKLQEMIEKGTIGDYKVPIFFNNIHPDEAPGIDVIIKLLEKFATEDVLTYKDYESTKEPMTPNRDGRNVEKPSTERIINIDVDEALNNVIFLFNFTENPDGRYYNVRQNVNGFDVNRDNGYQTQIESRLVTAEIAKWSPISMIDYHGFVNGFLIEPCTTPHEPNYEYDLLIENMVEQAHLMGRAGIANTMYESYQIPYEDYAGGWDDGTPAYTPTYAMFHGSMASTIEMPDINEESLNATYFAGLACVNYVMTNKDRLFHNQLEIFRRGVENIDDRRVDAYMLNAAGDAIGRPRGENENFFPDYYVIPVEKPLQRNALEAYNIAEYLLRNDVKVE